MFDVAGVDGGHPLVLSSSLSGEVDEHFAPVALAVCAVEESGFDESSYDPVARAVRDEEAFGKITHPDRSAVGRDLMQHVVVVERVTASRS